MGNRPTLKDVSRAAGVSIFTASRALTSGAGISPVTREHVREVAKELGYVANRVARGLRQGTTTTVGILAANSINPYYATLITSIEQVLRQQGYHGLVMDAVLGGEYRRDREDAFVEDLIQQQVAGVVLTFAIAVENVQKLAQRGIELVFVDADPPRGFEHLPSVNPDNESASRALGEHLVDHGYASPWLFVGFPVSYSARVPRQRGFEVAAHNAGVDVVVLEGRNDAASAFAVVDSYLAHALAAGERPPRAAFLANELLLQGALRAFRERGLHVPTDVALVSYDDFSWAPYIEPAATVVDQQIPEVGRSAAEILLAQLETPGSRAGHRTQIRPQLVVRQSCGCHDSSPVLPGRTRTRKSADEGRKRS